MNDLPAMGHPLRVAVASPVKHDGKNAPRMDLLLSLSARYHGQPLALRAVDSGRTSHDLRKLTQVSRVITTVAVFVS